MKERILQRLLGWAVSFAQICVFLIALLSVIILLVLAGAGVLVTSSAFLFARLIIELEDMALRYTPERKSGRSFTEHKRN